jgi:hypothetical protein
MRTAVTPSGNTSLLRVAGWSLILAAIVAVAGIVFLALMYASFATGVQRDGERFGATNDILVVVQYVLMLPRSRPRMSWAASAGRAAASLSPPPA